MGHECIAAIGPQKMHATGLNEASRFCEPEAMRRRLHQNAADQKARAACA